MRSKVIVTLTIAEAKALSQAVGNSLASYDDAMDILLDRHTVKAAYRASNKLDDAIRAVNGFDPKRSK